MYAARTAGTWEWAPASHVDVIHSIYMLMTSWTPRMPLTLGADRDAAVCVCVRARARMRTAHARDETCVCVCRAHAHAGNDAHAGDETGVQQNAPELRRDDARRRGN